MKRLFQWAAVLCLGLTVSQVSAQDDGAMAVIDRYEQVTGLDKLTPAEMTSVMMEVATEVQGMRIPMKMILKEPGKLNVDMEMAGQKMKMIVDGDQGWISVPGQGVMPMPAEPLAQLKEQTNVSQNYRWNKTDYSYKLAGEIEEGGHTYVGVQMIPNKPQPQVSNMIVYFDKATGLAAYVTMDVNQGAQSAAARMNFSDYKTYGKLKLPSKYKMLVGGNEMMNMEIKVLEYNYPTTEAMFAKPE